MLTPLSCVLFVIFIVFGTSLCAIPSPLPQKVIIDTDMALDDWLAILYLLHRQDVEVIGITITGTGLTHCEPGIKNALKLIQLAKKQSIPVACGRSTPFAFGSSFPVSWRLDTDHLMGHTLAAATETVPPFTAPELLLWLTQNNASKITLLTLGPLTNIADTLLLDPDFPEYIEQIVIMGGALDVPGNVHSTDPSYTNTTAEWNIYVDPKAFEHVLKSDLAITLIPLDVSNHVPLNQHFFEKLKQRRETPSAEFVYQVLSKEDNFSLPENWCFWDPLAAALAVEPSFATFEEQRIGVFLAPESKVGQTVVQKTGKPVRVAVQVDPEAFQNHFIHILNKL